MLRNEIGDEVFWEGIRKYYQKYQNGNALTEDFKNEMESVSSRDLDTFFNEWIFSPGQPDLNVSWSYKKGSKKLLVEFEQIQKESLFIFPMELRVQFANGESQNFKVNMTERSGSFAFECPELPVEFFVDPEVKLLHTINSISKQ
jgi:aminopeptidase N